MKNEIVKSNEIIKAKKDIMNFYEIKLFNLVFSKLNNFIKLDDVKDEDCEFKINKSELSSIFGDDINKHYDHLIKNVKSLSKKQISYQDERYDKMINIFSDFIYDKKLGYLIGGVNKKIKTFYFELQNNKVGFSKLLINNMKVCKSKYGIILYENLIKNKVIIDINKELVIDIEDVRTFFNIEESKYKQNRALKINVIEKALFDINNNIDYKYKVGFDWGKNGRKVISVVFNFTDLTNSN